MDIITEHKPKTLRMRLMLTAWNAKISAISQELSKPKFTALFRDSCSPCFH